MTCHLPRKPYSPPAPEPATCSDPTCENPAVSCGLCATHYQRQRRGGGPGPIRPHAVIAGSARRCLAMSGEHWQRLGELAAVRRTSTSELVRQAVARWLAELDLQAAQEARDAAVQAILLVPVDAPVEAKRAALERAKVAREELLEAEQAMREVKKREAAAPPAPPGPESPRGAGAPA